MENSKSKQEEQLNLPVHMLICGSDRFRENLLTLKTDPIYCALAKTRLPKYISSALIKILAQTARDIDTSRVGKCIFMSENGDRAWFVLVSGKMSVARCSADSTNEGEQRCDIEVGDIFGGYVGGEDAEHIRVEVIEPSRYVELRWEELEKLGEESTSRLLAIIGGHFH